MEVSKKEIALTFVAVAVVCALAGSGLAWLIVERGTQPGVTGSATFVTSAEGSATKSSAASQEPDLMEAAEEATVMGLVVCSSCSLGIEAQNEHRPFLVSEAPYRVFEILPNGQREKLEQTTGACAAGNYKITTTGKIDVVESYNSIQITDFTMEKVGEGSDTKADNN